MTEQVRFKAIIKRVAKPSLLKTLSLFGVNYGTIFPGLEGAARYAEEHYFYFKGFKGDLRQLYKKQTEPAAKKPDQATTPHVS